VARVVLSGIRLVKDFVAWKGFWGILSPTVRRALDGVSLDLVAGETLGIYGPNAAGKTTLLKLLAGLLAPTSGQVQVHGTDLAGGDAAVRLGVAIAIAESRSFYWRLTLRQNLDFFAALWGLSGPDRRSRIADAAERMGLRPFLDEKFHTLSSGMMQRCALARTMLSPAQIWLLDEPSRDLDRACKERLLEEIARLRTGGGGVVLVSHEERDLVRLCDRVLLLEAGRVGREGPPEELFAQGPEARP
jgi:ABC-2 type transport system ATP-binding protein